MSAQRSSLAKGRCLPCEGGVPPLTAAEVESLLREVDGWTVSDGVLSKEYRFANHYEVMAFVNAVAWISHREDHHPDLTVGYNTCRVAYITHAVKGLTRNDFICAAKVDALFDL
ncbi:MAG: 4a-hydroxytetrahydrobiopterin dehydratase [Thiobacillaceae bacterium]|nr:4a-hydroxytetrahydrobiopterin dehydratase [Thiobacillaceae bacterium]MCX7673819.1 4a-hydroxytetrahydrobiopterin dehydratase [Thiobacillaceae bacterium]MDW8323577.1 4a-hydroxytetrahydrobiopterin dehydratase [Burkholderiales bacterium]